MILTKGLRRVFSGATDAVNGLVLADDGSRLFAASSDKKVYSWRVPAEGGADDVPPSGSFSHAAIVRAVSTNADGSRLAAVGDDKLVTVWDAASGLMLEQLSGHAEAVLDVALSADGTTLVSGSTDKTARWWQLAAQQVVQADATRLLGFAVNADGTEFVD